MESTVKRKTLPRSNVVSLPERTSEPKEKTAGALRNFQGGVEPRRRKGRKRYVLANTREEMIREEKEGFSSSRTKDRQAKGG